MGIFIGEGIVKNDNNTCKVLAIDTKEKYEVIEVNPKDLLNFEYYTLDIAPDTDSENEETPLTGRQERIKKLNTLIDQKDLNEKEKQQVRSILEELHDTFLLCGDPMPATDLVYHEIHLTDDRPIRSKPYRQPSLYKDIIKKDIEDKLKNDIIEPSASPMSSPLIILAKKLDSQGQPRYRIVIDFRKLNKWTIPDVYLIPNISDILDQLGNSNYFSTFDLAHRFH